MRSGADDVYQSRILFRSKVMDRPKNLLGWSGWSRNLNFRSHASPLKSFFCACWNVFASGQLRKHVCDVPKKVDSMTHIGDYKMSLIDSLSLAQQSRRHDSPPFRGSHRLNVSDGLSIRSLTPEMKSLFSQKFGLAQ